MKASRRDFLTIAASLAVGTRAVRAEPGPQAQGPGERNGAAFDQVWELVRDRFYDPRLHGLDWEAMRARYRPQAEAAGSREELAAAVNAMLATLGASHTRYYTPDDPAYYQLADIFAGALQHRGGLMRVFPKGEVRYPGIGAFTEADDRGRTFVAGVIEGARRIRPDFWSATRSCRPTTGRSGPSDRSAARSGRRSPCRSGGSKTEPRQRSRSLRPICSRARCF